MQQFNNNPRPMLFQCGFSSAPRKPGRYLAMPNVPGRQFFPDLNPVNLSKTLDMQFCSPKKHRGRSLFYMPGHMILTLCIYGGLFTSMHAVSNSSIQLGKTRSLHVHVLQRHGIDSLIKKF